MKLVMMFVVSVVMIPTLAFGWSSPGHQAIAMAAMQMLPAATRAKVVAILKSETPADAATWLDDVREGKISEPQFSADFPANRNWHFVDYPIGSSKYDIAGRFSSPDDVVHAIENAVAVLEGKTSKMTKLEAMRVVLHLVGDIHQPLHCETGFYDLSDMSHPKLLKTVKDPKSTPSDRGGNQLFFSPSQELHAMWDRTLPDSVGKSSTALAAKITAKDFTSQFGTAGNFHHWPETWASDTMKQASEAYRGVAFSSAANVPDPRHPGKLMLKILVDLPGGTNQYKQDQKDRAQVQLTKAAVHLAQLLNAINYK